MQNDVIVAISSPYGKAGIAVVRMSGAGCLSIAEQMFTPYKKCVEYTPNRMVLGKIDLITTCDKGFLVFFQSPRSYTGEDVVEFQCHGGIYVAQRIVERALSLGARLAEAGEFSKRAFLNGKMSLDEAEGVIDTINAESESELRTASSLTRGELYRKIQSMLDRLVDVMSEIEVNLDYPEHDIDYATQDKILSNVTSIKGEVDTLISSKTQGRLIKDGINVAIVGKPNVGKSMLLNSLLGEDTAIVTDIEGTTRDVVAGHMEYKGMKFNFLDTAGVRETSDKVEKVGIDRAKQTLSESDIVLFVLDASRELSEEDRQTALLCSDKKKLVVVNKIDLSQPSEDILTLTDAEVIQISAKEGKGIDLLKDKIYDMALSTSSTSSSIILTNMRHITALMQASKMCEDILTAGERVPLDLLSLDIRMLYDKLGEITGQTLSEEVIDRIFSKFCLGK